MDSTNHIKSTIKAELLPFVAVIHNQLPVITPLIKGTSKPKKLPSNMA